MLGTGWPDGTIEQYVSHVVYRSGFDSKEDWTEVGWARLAEAYPILRGNIPYICL